MLVSPCDWNLAWSLAKPGVGLGYLATVEHQKVWPTRIESCLLTASCNVNIHCVSESRGCVFQTRDRFKPSGEETSVMSTLTNAWWWMTPTSRGHLFIVWQPTIGCNVLKDERKVSPD